MGSVDEPVERTRAVATLTVRPLDADRSSKLEAAASGSSREDGLTSPASAAEVLSA